MKIQGMKRFAKSSRLQADSVPEVTGPFERAVLDLGQDIKFDGAKLRPGHVLNALIHAFNEMPAAEQKPIVESAIARLELLLAEDEEEKSSAEGKIARLPIVGHGVKHESKKKGTG